MYIENDLAFDAQGNVIGTATPGPFSVSAIKIERVDLKGNMVEVTGHRGGLIFTTRATSSRPAQFDFVPFKPDVHIRIAIAADHPETLQLVLNKLLAPSFVDALADKTPEQRQTALESIAQIVPLAKSGTGTSQPAGSATTSSPDSTIVGVYKIGKDVTPPRVLSYVQPAFPAVTPRMDSTICVLDLVVDKTGFPTHIRVKQSLSSEQDRAAVVAVSQDRFAPAMYDNHPVAVEINFEVGFPGR